MAFIYDLTDTWNAGGTTFSAIKMNVTDTASASASKLVQCQISGTDKFTVGKDGGGYFAGNVGIGTSSPDSLIEVSDPTSATIKVTKSGGTAVETTLFSSSSGVGGVGTATNQDFTLRTNSAERMRITSDGTVAVGTTSPIATARTHLQLNSNANFTGTLQAAVSPTQLVLRDVSNTTTYPNCYTNILFGEGATGAHWQYIAGVRDAGLVFGTATGSTPTERMRIDSIGRVGIGTTSPTEKLTVSSGDILLSNAYSIKGRNAANTLSIGMLRRNASDQVAIDEDGYGTVIGFGGVLGVFGSGNVGIGTSSPGATLHVSGTAATPAVLGRTSSDTNCNIEYRGSATSVYAGKGAGDIWAVGSAADLSNATTTKFVIDTGNGNVGIGTASPDAKTNIVVSSTGRAWSPTAGFSDLVVERNANAGFTVVASNTANSYVNFADTDDENAGMIVYQHSDNAMTFRTNGSGEDMRIDSAGNVGIGTNAPATLTSGITALSISDSGAKTTGDKIGELNFVTDDGSFTGTFSDGIGAAINAVATSATGAAYGLTFTTATITGSDRAERMRIDSSGNVGIGTSSPGAKLDVRPAANNIVQVKSASHDTLTALAAATTYSRGGDGITDLAAVFGWNNGGLAMAGRAGLAFATGGASSYSATIERMRIDSSGNLLVGTTTSNGDGISMKPRASAGSTSQINFNRASSTTTGYPIVFQNGGTDVGFISHNNTTTTYNTSSDARLKHDIVDAPDAADLIDAIKVRSFKWNADNSEQRYGMVAQELLEVAPEAVSGEPEGEDMMGVDYSKLVPMLIKEIQSLRARVAQLEG